MNAIVINNLIKTYKKNNKEIKVLKKINKKFSYGKFYLIVGHSGSGKSTLLRILGLIDNPTEGQVFIADKDVNEFSNKELAILRNKEIGFIFQEFLLDKYLTAKENISIPMLINKTNFIDKRSINNRCNDLLKEVGLSDRGKHFPKELSGGEQQRVSIARALANDPHIILADEPTGNLDNETEEYIFKKLKEMSREGKCIIMVSHSKDAKKYADEIIELKEGVLK